MDVEAIRAELPVLERLAYLNAGTNGPLPRRTVEAMCSALGSDLEEGRSSGPYFETMLARRDEVRAALAAVLDAAPEDVALTSSTTEGCNVVLNGLGIGPGDEVVTTDSEHPGLFGGLVASGADVRAVPVRDLAVADVLGALEAAIGEGTRLIALSHVSWLTGARFPVGELAGRGVPFLVDGAQAAGAIPVDVDELGCDFYTVSAQKWLLGPDVTGALYVRPDRVPELRMAMPSYGSWDFEEGYTYEPRAGAARFDPGWISPVAAAGLLASLAFASEAGEERFQHAAATAAHLRRALEAAGHEVVTEPEQATLVTWKADGDSKAVVERLADAGVVIRDVPDVGWLRASCGFWTNEDDLERLLGAL
ncbi:MAG TPA: aminotransferase class V-fold PLP-dependent enzyme [Gaiellaceae bacterium]|nr:aminotransferase class V-fold PLP-dependent enzyme [Gaiellaceae bacterium]